MDKEKIPRKRMLSDNRAMTLPSPPPSPQPANRVHPPAYPEAFTRLLDYRAREIEFLKTLDDVIAVDCTKMKNKSASRAHQEHEQGESDREEISTTGVQSTYQQDTPQLSPHQQYSETQSKERKITPPCNIHPHSPVRLEPLGFEGDYLREECENYLMPLLNRTGPSISAALVTYDAFDQLTKLHSLLNQLIHVRNQNYLMQRQVRDVRTLCELKKLQKKDSTEMADDIELSDNELDLSAILAAGNSATTKRNTAKRQRERSKSVIADDIQMFASEKEKTSSLRRQSQSAFSDSNSTKSKVSKWTKVKAAFKWERANVGSMNEGKSLDSGISLGPINHEVARYLRVPSVPCTGSSADSVLSSSSGHLLSGGSVPATPGTISSASSIEDVGAASEENRNNRDSSKSDSRCDSRANDEDSRRSRSLDGDTVIGQPLTRDGKNKTPWKKVKDIIQTHRGSFKGKSRTRSVKSGGTCSRDHSPCDSIDALCNIEDNASSNPASPGHKNAPAVSVSYDSSSHLYWPHGSASGLHSRDDFDGKSSRSSSKVNRKSKILTDFEVLPEDVTVDVKSSGNVQRGRLPPSPLNLRQDSSDIEFGDMSHSPTFFGKTPPKFFRTRKLASGNSSVPSSPSRHSEFFGECDTNIHSEDFSSGDFSEPSSPRHPNQKISPKSSFLLQQKEINEKYYELCEQLAQEFETKQEEWKKIQAACVATASSAYQIISKEEGSLSSKNVPATLLEENLSAEFKKKLHKWRVKKQGSVTTKDPQISPTKETEQKKIDWNLWKTGQLKLEGQGLTPMPDQKDLPEDFQKKLEQWRKLKESNAVQPYNRYDSLKRLKKPKDDPDRFDRDKNRPDRDKAKSAERDKLEKLSKLKAMVTDPPAKEIEVKTSVGVMKFEGISRKFTRKLYEWEKARGIGPESSTFALLHPGYRPLDVGNGTRDNGPKENSPVLGRSLSLDSISPNPSVPSISHQPSSLSLNDMKESNSIPADLDETENSEFETKTNQHQDEPEAVIVEVEDDIVETAAPLLTAHPIVEQQTPVYRYEIPSAELCSGKPETLLGRISTQTRSLSTQALQNIGKLKRLQSQQDEDFKEHIKHVLCVVQSLKESLPDLESSIRSGSPHGQETFSVVKRLVEELIEMLECLTRTESFNTSEFRERTKQIDSKLSSLKKSIDLVCKYIESRRPSELIPEINIISDDTSERGRVVVCTTPIIFQPEVITNQPQVYLDSHPVYEPTSVLDQQRLDPGEGCSKKINRTTSNGSKKKMRLRKMGSRQNSKTESDSDEDSLNVTLEAPRRIKRKTSKAKRSVEEERKLEEKENYAGEDIVYILKVKPGQKIEQEVKQELSERNVLISPTELCVELLEAPSIETSSNSANIFVKTKRKVFTTIDEASNVAGGGSETKAVIAKELESSSASEHTERESSICESDKTKIPAPSLTPVSLSPKTQRRVEMPKTGPLKELSPSIRMLIQRYNKTVEKSTIKKSGSCSPVTFRSPILARRAKTQSEKYQKNVERVVKSESAGNIQVKALTVVNTFDVDSKADGFTIPKASSAEAIPTDRKNSDQSADGTYVLGSSLACDSLGEIRTTPPTSPTPGTEKDTKKEHLYKKNKEKPTSLFGKTGAIKKIGLRTGKAGDNPWRRSLSSTPSESFSLPDKSDNTVPRITRKYETAVEIYSKSAPSTPMAEDDDDGKPKTPFSERAMKLQRAKEEFLRRDIQRSSTWETSSTKDDVWLKRLSGSSFSSTASNEIKEGTLLKSASVGFINTSGGDSATDHLESVDYVPLPRPLEKSSSKFAFSSIASKFRKVRMRRGSRDPVPKYNAVSALCRQSLAVVDLRADSNALQEQILRNEDTEKTTVQKSGSSHGLGFWSGLRKFDKLTKSKSAHTLSQNENDTKEM